MTLASGQLPYDYAHGQGPFRVANPYKTNFPIGPSGVLLEQAAFVITAERRKLMKFLNGNAYLDDYFLYVNPIISPSGGFEPKANGSTLGNQVYPGAAFIIDHIHDIRASLTNFFTFLSQDTDYTGDAYRAAWLQAVYPNSPSGYYQATDPDLFTIVVGQWSHRFPSETGVITYTNDDVLGASGVLYDVDFGEVMFNPPPHLAAFGIVTMHSKKVNGQNDGFGVQMYPIFPAFQKTDGTIIPLTNREPVSIPQVPDYSIAHITSGEMRIDGYAIFGKTLLYLGRNGQIFDTTSASFTTGPEGLRQVLFGGNVSGARIFATPTAQSSGVYRIASRNRFIDFPTTTVESGSMSVWPNIVSYWPNELTAGDQLVGSTTTRSNLGYHVFDDCIWMTDTAVGVSPTTGFASGLAILSPFTGHRMWVRYADQTAIPSIPLGGSTAINKNWSSSVGLTRLAANTTYRLHPNIQRDFTSASGQGIFGKYNDMLDLIATVTTKSNIVQPGIADQFPLGTSTDLTFNDYWHDDSADEYWLSNSQNVGIDMWKFDSLFKYVNKYIFNSPSGIFNARGFFNNGNHFLFHGEFGPTGGTNIIGSGIYPVHILSEGTDPYGDDAVIPNCGNAAIYPWEAKPINGAPFVGFQNFAEILDIFVVPVATHVYPGVYATVSWRVSAGDPSIYLVRIEESTSTWEIKSISRMETNIQASQRRELLYMPY